MNAMTRRQQAIYDFIVRQVRHNGIPPTLIEIAENFGLASAATVSDHLKAIERKGFIRRRPGASRGIEVSALKRRRESDRAVRVPLRGDVPSGSRPVDPARAPTVIVDGRMAPGEAFALRAATRALERRGILEGDLLIVDSTATLEPGNLVVGLQRRGTLLLELSTGGGRVRPLAGRLTPEDEVELVGSVVAVLRTARGLGTR